MSERFPLLGQLRTDRERAESEIAAPYVEMTSFAVRREQRARDHIRSLEQVFGSKVATDLHRCFADDLNSEIRRHILDALSQHRQKVGGLVTITVEADTLKFMDQRLWPKYILDRYMAEALPASRLMLDGNQMVDPTARVRRVTIMIPDLNVTRDVVMDD